MQKAPPASVVLWQSFSWLPVSCFCGDLIWFCSQATTMCHRLTIQGHINIVVVYANFSSDANKLFFLAPSWRIQWKQQLVKTVEAQRTAFLHFIVNHLFLSRKMPLEEILQSSLQHEGCCNFQHFVTYEIHFVKARKTSSSKDAQYIQSF